MRVEGSGFRLLAVVLRLDEIGVVPATALLLAPVDDCPARGLNVVEDVPF